MQLTTKLNISDCHQLDSNRLTIGHNTKKWVKEEEDEETIIIIVINYISLQSDVGHYKLTVVQYIDIGQLGECSTFLVDSWENAVHCLWTIGRMQYIANGQLGECSALLVDSWENAVHC